MAFILNPVLVFTFGFDGTRPREVYSVYFPARSVAFSPIGFYDNIFNAPRMSLYVEVGFPNGAKIDVEATREEVLSGLKREGIITHQKLVAEHSVVMNPAYVHITQQSMAAFSTHSQKLNEFGVYSIGRYGGWTYCSIEDNIIEARTLATRLGIAKAWPAKAA